MSPDDAVRVYRAALAASRPSSRNRRRGGAGRAFRQVLSALDHHPPTELDLPDERVLVWSDLHLGHANVIDYGHRPFVDVEVMDRALWDAWESAANPWTLLVCVGDVAMRAALREDTWGRIRRMPGRQELVLGNHDLTGRGRLRVDGFDRVWSLLTAPGDPPLIFTHMPLPEVPDGHVNVHGHMHDGPVTRTPHVNVSVEQLDYRPLSLARLRRLAMRLVEGHYPPGRTTLGRVRALEAAWPSDPPPTRSPGGSIVGTAVHRTDAEGESEA